MSLEEMKKQLIDKVEKIEDKITLQKILDMLESSRPRPHIEEIFEEAKSQYGETLKRLAKEFSTQYQYLK